MRGFPKMLFYAHVCCKMAIHAKESSDNFARIYIVTLKQEGYAI